MTINPSDHEYFPADFSQLYALGYHELCTYLEAFLDGDLTQVELYDHYRHQINKHVARLDHMATQSARAVRDSINFARQE